MINRRSFDVVWYLSVYIFRLIYSSFHLHRQDNTINISSCCNVCCVLILLDGIVQEFDKFLVFQIFFFSIVLPSIFSFYITSELYTKVFKAKMAYTYWYMSNCSWNVKYGVHPINENFAASKAGLVINLKRKNPRPGTVQRKGNTS